MALERSFVTTLATFGGIGRVPFAPGTWGSLAGLLLAWFLPYGFPFLAAGLSVCGLLICKAARKEFAADDPQRFVLDEVCGMMLALFFVPRDLLWFGAAFLLFRAFDGWKIWPVNLAERIPTARSIMWDDLVAGMIVCGIVNGVVALLSR